MATIVNNPAPTNDQSNSLMPLVYLGVFIALIVFAIYFGLPVLRRATTPNQTQITVPDKIDVNVSTDQGSGN